MDGILVQLPLPKGFDTHEVISWIDPAKDVDGIHPTNLGLLLQNQPGPRACTPLGCLELIPSTGVAIEGQDVVDHRPEPDRRQAPGGHDHERERHGHDLPQQDPGSAPASAPGPISSIAAMGKPGFVGPEFVKEGAVVIDVGSNAVTDKDARPRGSSATTPSG